MLPRPPPGLLRDPIMIFQSTCCDWTQQEGNLEKSLDTVFWAMAFCTQVAEPFVCVDFLFFLPLLPPLFRCRCQPRQVLALGGVEQWLAVITGAKPAYCKLYSLQSETLFSSSPRINLTTGNSELSAADCNYFKLFWHVPWASIFNTLNQTTGCHFWHSGGDIKEGEDIWR